ncbi:MAG: NADH-quinone oxidoreductase subunit N [Bdellovibrionales bacterium]|nr:NADH-quinone oxidoreductase subunit N [Bdellovibrionales bacterium]
MELSFGWNDVFLVSPAIVLFLFSLLPVFLKVINGNKADSLFTSYGVSLIGLFVAAGFSVAVVFRQILEGGSQLAFSDALVMDGLSSFASLMVIVISIFALLLSRDSLALKGELFSEFCFLLLNAAVGMMVVAWSNDLILTFIGIEMMSLCLYIMIAMSHEPIFSKESAFKYFVLGSFASAILLYGMAFLYGATGSTYLPDISEMAAEMVLTHRIFIIGILFTLVGFVFKVAIVPFHAWTPDVYQGSPTSITAFMATGVKVVVFIALIRFMLTDFVLTPDSIISQVLQWLAVITMVVGNFVAIKQDNLKRMLAYSSISHSGYILVGLIAASLPGSQVEGVSAVLFYSLSYAVMTIGSFAVVALFEKQHDTQVNINDLKGLATSNPYVAFSLTAILISLAGIPPTIGFFGKFFVFSSAIKQGLYWITIWGVISSVVSVYYYLRPVVYMYMKEADFGQQSMLRDDAQSTKFTVFFASLFVIIAGLLSQLFYDLIGHSVMTLF